jgi:hypothetical protein
VTVGDLKKFLEAVPDDYKVVSGGWSARLTIDPDNKRVKVEA